MADQPSQVTDRSPKRVRHEVRVRTLDVAAVEKIAPRMIRVTLTGAELEGFVDMGFDDHVKLFIPGPGQEVPNLPVVGPPGIQMPEGMTRPLARDYTPRRYDAETGRLDIDFVLHDDGPATLWAQQVKPGMKGFIAGPRGSFVIPLTFDWHLLIGDETALPAIARRLEELPADTKALAFIEVESAADELPIETAADARIVWVHRGSYPLGSDTALLAALAATPFPDGDYHAWAGCESSVAKAVRAWLIANRGANPKWMRVSGYWRIGAAGFHDHHDE